MTTDAKTFLEMDAGEQREFLTQALADWIDAGFWSLPRSNTFRRRVRILAASVGMTRADLMNELREDAQGLGAATDRGASR